MAVVLAIVGVVLAVLLITLLYILYFRPAYTERTQTFLLGAVLLVTIILVVAGVTFSKSLTVDDAVTRREELRATLEETNHQLTQLMEELDEVTDALRRSGGGTG